MSIVLFAIIGTTINAGTGYWVCFSGYCVIKAIGFICGVINAVKWG